MMIKKTTKKLIPLLMLICLININLFSQTLDTNYKIDKLGGVAKNVQIKYDVPTLMSEISNNLLISSINSKLGKPYKWGSIGPNSYDCSGFVWKVFSENNIKFTRSTAREYWRKFKPVIENDRFKIGTLVFFSNLKHVGIVLDDKGFYHASKSKGITYSKFNKYWISRIVGFRKIN